MKPPPTISKFEVLLDAIRGRASAADLALLQQTAFTYFMGTQREQVEAAIAKRESELPSGDALGR